QIADPLDRDVRRRVGGPLGGVRVVSLAREDGRQAVAPALLHRGQDAELVVDEHVVVRGEARLDVVELPLLVDVDQDAAVDRVEEPRALDLARLEDDIAVGQDDGRTERREMLEHVERAREEPVREGIVHEERGDREEMGIPRVLDPVALQRAQVVGVAELGAEVLEDGPVACFGLGTDLAPEIAPQVRGDAVVVDERVVDVEEEDDGARRCHPRHLLSSRAAAGASTSQRRRPSWGATTWAGSASGSWGPSSTRRSIGAFSAPETRNATSAAALSTTGVSVTRHISTASTRSATTHRSVSRIAVPPGKSEAVCPLSPMPRRTRSKRTPGARRGGPTGVANVSRSTRSYAAAARRGSSSPRMRWTFCSETGTCASSASRAIR